MKRLSYLLPCLSFLLPIAVHAAGVGDLVKVSTSPAVYYIGADQQRHAFPMQNIYQSWFADFSAVKTISAADLATYYLGANIYYRPGMRMVKITTDPKVYAVAPHGLLRWIETESLATQLYGANWNTKIDDLPDVFFSGYTIGANIANPGDFDPASVASANATIDINQFGTATTSPPTATSTPPVATSTGYMATVSASTNSPHVGQTFDVFGYATPVAGLSSIRLSTDGTMASTLTTCASSPCGSSFTIPRSGTQASYDIIADVKWLNGQEAISTLTLPVDTAVSGYETIAITNPEVEPNGTVEIVATSDSNFIAHYLDIYVDGVDVRGCTNYQQCRYLGTEQSPIGTVHSVYAIAADTNGQTARTETQTYRVVADDHPLVTATPGKNLLYVNETLDVTVNASDAEAVSSTEVWLDGTMLKHCNASTCTVIAGPWSAPRTLYFIGKAWDITGLQGQATSSEVTVQ